VSSTDRLDVLSLDGGKITVWADGDGPSLVLVHGSMCDHTTFNALIAELRAVFRCFAMDRRGFGSTPESGDYSADREFDDVAAVVDAVASEVGTSVALFGHSWGASCAMGGAARTPNVRRLLLYEPSLGLSYPPGSIEAIDAKVVSGDFEGAVLSVLVDIAGMTEGEVEELKASAVWPARVATAPTIAREARIEANWVLAPRQFDRIAAPTLLLSGSESPPELADVVRRSAEAIPSSRIAVLDGRGHFAYRTHPREVAAVIAGFCSATLGKPPDP
jgi:pimeloyl-ACP methyl ester carboxylesterase